MTKIEDVKEEMRLMTERVDKLKSSCSKLEMFDGLQTIQTTNSLDDNKMRLEKAKRELEEFIENNLEYVI